MTKEVSVLEFIRIFKKRILMIILFCIMGVLLFSFLTFIVATPKYKSTSQLLVSHSRTEVVTSGIDIGTNLQLIDTYKDIIKGPVILEDVQSTLNLNTTIDNLSEQVEVLTQDNSQVFSVVVTDENPQQAALMANTIAETFYNNIWDIMNIDNVTIISRAQPNLVPSSPNVNLNLIIGFVISFTIGIGLAVLLEWMDNTIKDEESIARELGWSTLGEVIEYTEKKVVKDFEKKNSKDQSETAIVRNRV